MKITEGMKVRLIDDAAACEWTVTKVYRVGRRKQVQITRKMLCSYSMHARLDQVKRVTPGKAGES